MEILMVLKKVCSPWRNFCARRFENLISGTNANLRSWNVNLHSWSAYLSVCKNRNANLRSWSSHRRSSSERRFALMDSKYALVCHTEVVLECVIW